jgi:DNA-binding transcriptional ArsR family regulator
MLIEGIRAESIRFAFSPLQETLRAMHVFVEARHHAEQMEWVRSARRRVTPTLRRAILGYRFLLDPPELFPEAFPNETASTFADELALLRKREVDFRNAMVRRMLDAALVRKETIDAASRPAALRQLVAAAVRRHPRDAALLTAFAEKPGKTLRDFCDTVGMFFERCLQEQWQFFESRARDDAAARQQLLGRFGVAAMLRTLTRQITIFGDRRSASIESGNEGAAETIEMQPGASVALTPSYFIWPHATFVVLKLRELSVRIAYPIASPSTTPLPRKRYDAVAQRFAALADATRLRMIELLGQRDLSTRELAGLLGLSESGVSRHLTILRKASLVDSVREGYFVLYRKAAGVDDVIRVATAIQ